eukprot:1810994-Amphidinium_carterae.1
MEPTTDCRQRLLSLPVLMIELTNTSSTACQQQGRWKQPFLEDKVAENCLCSWFIRATFEQCHPCASRSTKLHPRMSKDLLN